MLNVNDILETIKMIDEDCLDVRTVTMGISLLDCADSDIDRSCQKVYDKITRLAKDLVRTGEDIERTYGIPIINKRISVTPIAMLVAASGGDPVKYAKALQRAADTCGVNFIGGYSALVQKGFSAGDRELIESIPQAMDETENVCSSINIGSTKAGLNLDAIKLMGEVVKATAERTAYKECIGCAKLVVFCNAPEDNPFMAGAFHGVGEPDCVIHVGVSGPGVVRAALAKVDKTLPIDEIADTTKKTAFKITRLRQPLGTEARILEEMGLEQCGAHGTTATLALLNDAVKKGGVMASSRVGGLSGAFIPVSEDAGMIDAVTTGALSIEKLEAMTAVCSVGLDMIIIPGDTTPAIISGIIADEAAIGMVNSKTTAVRVIPAVGRKEGDTLTFGGLLGYGPVIKVNRNSPEVFINRGGHIPAPLQSLKN